MPAMCVWRARSGYPRQSLVKLGFHLHTNNAAPWKGCTPRDDGGVVIAGATFSQRGSQNWK